MNGYRIPKALSIKQPWAWLICSGFKDVENRYWYRRNYPKLIYVHASNSKSDMTKEVLARIMRRLTGKQAAELMVVYERLAFGAVIGEVSITECRYRPGDENANLFSKWHEAGQYGFYLKNPVLYVNPIPCAGKLGFFEIESSGGASAGTIVGQEGQNSSKTRSLGRVEDGKR